MPSPINSSYEALTSRLAVTRRKEELLRLVGGILSTLTMSAALWLLFTVLEFWVHGTTQLRTVLYWVWLGSTCAGASWWMIPQVARLVGMKASYTIDEMALRVGKVYEDVGDMLCNVLQLHVMDGNGTLSRAAFTAVASTAATKDFDAVIETQDLRRSMLLFVASIILVVGSIGGLPNHLGAASVRLWNHTNSYLPPAPYRLDVSPRSASVMRGSTSCIVVTAHGTAPGSITLYVKEAGKERFDPFTIARDTANTYQYLLPSQTASVEFYAVGPWLDVGVNSDTGQITVIDRPLIRSLQGRVIAPSYTGLAPSDITDDHADVTALQGSTVDLTMTSNKDLKKAEIVLVKASGDSVADTVRVPMTVRGASASASFSVQYSGTYAIRCTDQEGQQNTDPIVHKIVVLTDAVPTISLVQPRQDAEVDQQAMLPISVSISDDYGFSWLRLNYRLVSSRYAQPEEKYHAIDLAINANGSTVAEVPYVWNLGKVGISPEDVFEFYLEVADNDRLHGPKTARTSTLKVRLPSLDEVFAETDKTQDLMQKELKEVAKEAEEIKKEAEQLQREMQKQQAQQKQSVDWKEKKQAEELLKRQEELAKKMEDVAQKLDDMTQKLEQNKAISPETLQKYMELQKLMKEVRTPELQRMQEEMKKAMEQMTPQQLKEAMKNFKFDEEQFKKQIERTLNLLKRMQAEQKADELTKRAEELARRQEELRKQTENTSPQNKEARKDLAKQQKEIQNDLEKLAQETNDLEKLMKELGDMPMDQMDKAKQELAQEQTKNEMEQSEKSMEQGDMQESSKSQQNASKNLQRFAQQMKNLKREMKRNSSKEAMRQMQRNIDDMLQLSKEQESLRDQMQSMDPNSSQFPQMAQRQQKLQESMQNTANSMMQLGQKSTSVTPEMAQDMGDALQSMKDAMQQMQDRNGQMSARDQGEAMSSMNSAVSRMQDALGQMMQGEGQGQGGQGQNPGMGKGSGKSPFQRLGELAGDQQSINEGSGKLGSNGQPMNGQQQAEIGRLASQQGRALKAMEELEKEQRESSGTRKPIGDLSKITQDMREVLTDMQSGSITPETKLRQERILSRLLNASRSVNDRDYEKQRESNSGTDVSRKSPGALDLDDVEQRQSMRQLMNTLREGYTKDYENLIRAYFESLQQQSVPSGR